MHKLEHVSSRGTPLNWFKNYLTNINQYVHVNNVDSSLRNLTCGVPQGPILGPLPFLIYINGIGEIAKLAKIRMFADDINVFIVSENTILQTQNAENTLLALSKWFAANKLSLNKDKSCYNIFASPSKLKTVPGYLNNIRLGDMMIKRVHHAKYLGLTLDESLSFQEHIDELSKQLNKLANSYKIVRYRVERDNKYNIYFAYTYSIMQYGIEVYGNACNEYINKLQVQQKNHLKFCFKSITEHTHTHTHTHTYTHTYTHTHDLYNELNLLKTPNMKNAQIAISCI